LNSAGIIMVDYVLEIKGKIVSTKADFGGNSVMTNELSLCRFIPGFLLTKGDLNTKTVKIK
jgi:hypothetical protein